MVKQNKSPEEIETDVNAFINSVNNKKISFLTADGQIAKNSLGEDMTFAASISPDIAEYGRTHAMSLRNKSEADTDYKIGEMKSAFDSYMGSEDIDKTGSSGSFSVLSVDEIIAKGIQQMSEIKAGNFKAGPTAEALNEIWNKTLRYATLKQLQEAAMAQKDLAPAQAALNKLNKDLASGAAGGINWTTYTLGLGNDKIGIPYTRLNPKDYNMSQTTSAQAYEHWKNLRDLLNTTLSGCNTINDLNIKCNSRLRQQAVDTSSVVETPESQRFVAGTTKFTQEYSNKMASFYNQSALFQEGKTNGAAPIVVDSILNSNISIFVLVLSAIFTKYFYIRIIYFYSR